MSPGDAYYIILGDEIVRVIYIRRKSTISHVIKRRSKTSGLTVWYGEIYSTERDARKALFIDRLATP